ncbi:MAG TPA: NTP transferase domain-containing protein [Thermoplasmata archaeon]|nr:NTP transferase domain-containing protein [Thermoplasmata archaeon]
MKVVILAAGKGQRMGPLTHNRPKAMLPVLNRPIVEHLILNARAAGLKEFVIVVNWKSETLKSYFGDGKDWGVNINWIDQAEVKGTAHAVAQVESHVKGDFVVLSGDTIVGSNTIEKLANAKENAIGVVKAKEPERYGVVYLQGSKISKILEKPRVSTSSFINTGLYHFTQEIFKAIKKTPLSQRKEYEITSSIQSLIDRGISTNATELTDWIDLTYPWDLLQANKKLFDTLEEGIKGEVENFVTLKGKVIVGDGSKVMDGSYIEGPALIGKNCEVGPNCYIRPTTVLADNCKVGNACDVKNSILMKNTKVPHQSYVGDSILGEGVNLGAGTKLANLRLDRTPVVARLNGEYVHTKLKKFGAVIGDGAQFGINSMTNPGTVIGANSLIGPGAIVYEELKEESEI